MADKKKLLEAVKLFGNGETAKASELLKECIRETAVQLMKEAVEEEKKPTNDQAATLIGEIKAEEPSEEELDLDTEGEAEETEVVTAEDAKEAIEDAAETAAVSEEELAALEAEFEKKLADAAIKMDTEDVEEAKAEAAEEKVKGEAEVKEAPAEKVQDIVDVEEFVK